MATSHTPSTMATGSSPGHALLPEDSLSPPAVATRVGVPRSPANTPMPAAVGSASVPVQPTDASHPVIATSSSSVQKHGEIAQMGVVIPGIGFLAYKYVALLALIAQTVGAILILRISRTVARAEVPYVMTTAVFMSEVFKLLGSFLLVVRDLDYDWMRAVQAINFDVFGKPLETLKVGVPALLYTVQNNLLFIAIANMSPAIYQVTYQLKTLTTAVLSVVVLNRSLGVDQWVALLVLTIGVALIQLPTNSEPAHEIVGNPFVGTVAVLCACVTSGFAGVYFEKILKGSKTSIWMRNIQLALFGSVLGLLGVITNDVATVMSGGFFQGYNSATWAAIIIQSLGGLIVAAVLKYADNILKCFGNAVAIILSFLASYFLLGDAALSWTFAIGSIAVIFSTYAYGTSMAVVTGGLQQAHRWRRMLFQYKKLDPRLPEDIELGRKQVEV